MTAEMDCAVISKRRIIEADLSDRDLADNTLINAYR